MIVGAAMDVYLFFLFCFVFLLVVFGVRSTVTQMT